MSSKADKEATKISTPRHGRHRSSSTSKEVCSAPAAKKRQSAMDLGWWRDSVSFYLYADTTIKKWDSYATSLMTMPVGPSLLQDSSFTFIVPTPNGAIPAKIDMPVDEQAERYFMEHYVTVPSRPGDRGSNSFVPKFLKLPDDEQMHCFRSAFRAASLAALATRPSARSLRARAQSEYVKAIRAVGEAVQGLSKGVGSSTQTLGSILLLTLYEAGIHWRVGSQHLGAFEAHVKGAVQLILLLGMDELQSQDSKEMVIMARGRMLMLKTLPGYETAHTSSLANSLMSVSYRDSLGRLGVWLASLCWRRDEIVNIIKAGRREPEVMTKLRRLRDETIQLGLKFYDAAQDIEDGCTLDQVFAKYGPLLQDLTQQTEAPDKTESPPGPGSGFNSPGDDAASTPSEAASDGSTIEVERDFPPKHMSFRDHREASFYLSSMVAALVIQNTVIRCTAWLHLDDEESDPGAHERTPEYVEAALLASRSVRGIVNTVNFYKLSLLKDDMNDLGRGVVAPYASVIAMLSTFYSALVSQFATEAQRRYLRQELEVMANEGGIAQISAYLGNQTIVVPKDDIIRDRERFRSLLRTSNSSTDSIMQGH
ncbi:hypothetical protein PpBr36_02742 [Pyricularia pennisetigena]|uniref:hypothetical protein n=1 Tax=Pyricularia pennisetigena TaxID=1578925 RepID=UPI0011508D7A|nr:hypothetical protein PpBr36_02742 [Pyricularia pennisetigena]TLS31569.1 hypothetical protein PpBr36_02742 [Pyricularia pennisetigena]